jgi:uncharacterized protein YkwD
MHRPNSAAFFRSLAATTAAAALSLTFTWLPATATQLPGDPAIVTLIAAEQALLVLTNADRAANGLSPLESDPETLAIARQRAASQIGTPKLSHFDAAGDMAFVGLLAGAQVRYQLAGENLARANNNDPAVIERIEHALMQSPMHRKNILEQSFNRVSIGAATDGNGQITFAEVYRN